MMPLKQCPHCGSTKGMYSKYILYGMRDDYDFKGNIFGNPDNSWQRGGKNLYCYSCNRYVCTVEEWEPHREALVEAGFSKAGY